MLPSHIFWTYFPFIGAELKIQLINHIILHESRSQLFEQIVCKKVGHVGHPLGSHPFSSRVGFPDSRQNFTHTGTFLSNDGFIHF